MEELRKLDVFILNLSDKLCALAPRIFIGTVIFILFWAAGIAVEAFMRRVSCRLRLPPEVSSLSQKTAKAFVVIIGLITALGTVGINISAMVAALGLTGFALGFAHRDTVSNVAAGVLILIYRPFKVGDRIGVMAFDGKIISIDLRYTSIMMENRKVLIPNSTLFNNPVSVFARED